MLNPARFSEAAHELPSEPRVGTSDATAPCRIEIGLEENGKRPNVVTSNGQQPISAPSTHL